mgnify:CR=1 FL=1
MNKKSFFAKRSELQKVDVLDIYIEKKSQKGIYEIKEKKMEEIIENLEGVETMIDQARLCLKETKFANNLELDEYIENIENNIEYALSVVK